jgi:hypothetical protein
LVKTVLAPSLLLPPASSPLVVSLTGGVPRELFVGNYVGTAEARYVCFTDYVSTALKE